MSDIPSTPKIEELRSRIGDKLAEIQRRAAHAKELVTPSTYWNNPWVRLGLGVVIGYAFGSRRRDGDGSSHEGLVHSVVRSGLGAAVSVLVGRTLALPPGES
ncbi:MAG: hypothetical protein JWP01_3553 [Myxococcales bacterium]|nr:hypothetical protein [Myxococcales bacterium]